MTFKTLYQCYWVAITICLVTFTPGNQLRAFPDMIPDEAGQQKALVEVLKEIEEHYQIFFTYEAKLLQDVKVHYTFNPEETAEHAISRVLSATGFQYQSYNSKFIVIFKNDKKGRKGAKKIGKRIQRIQKLEQKNNVVVKRNTPQESQKLNTIVESVLALQKDITVTGKVTDGLGEPLIGVNVFIKGTSTGTITEVDGTYSISVPDAESVLVFSYTGYLSQEITVGNQTAINIVLEENVEQLDEVVVVGYGSVRKSDLTGSVASVGSDQLKSTPILSLDQGLQGRVAGVQVTQGSHAPGGGVSIRVRGGNSLTAGTEPLYVVDGFPIYSDNSVFGAGDGGGNTGAQTNALAFLNPNDIESIEILKDASATAIYGSRGANGVVIITTKNGASGDAKVEFDSYIGIQSVANKLDLLNADEYISILNEARANAGEGPVTLESPYLGVDTDWQDEVFRDATIQSYQLSVSGGSEKSRYMISGNYFNQEGIVRNSDFERGSIRLNLDNKISNRIKLGTNITYSRSLNNGAITDNAGGGNGGVVLNAILFSPVMPVDTNGVLFIPPSQSVDMRGDLTNPVLLAESVRNELITDRLLASTFAEIELIDNLKLRISGGIDYSGAERKFFRPVLSENATGSGRNRGAIFNTTVYTWLNENTLTYDLNLNDDHKLNFLAGFTQQRQNVNAQRLEGLGLSDERTNVDQIELSETQGISAASSEWALLSWLGRVNYNLKGRYLFTLSARTDGSSRFGENNKWGFFPSAAFAWRAGNESFVQDLNVFSDLKFRVSYGISGNQEIGVNQSLSRLIALPSTGQIPGVQTTFANPDLQWERTKQFNAGLDMSFVENRFRVTFDYYFKETEDLLFNRPLPASFGGGTILDNIGSLTNQGIELGISTDNLVGAFKWTTALNFSLNRNEVTDLPVPGIENGLPINNSDGHIQYGFTHLLEEGQPIGNFFGFETNGIWQTADVEALGEEAATALGAIPGEVRFVDTNGDGVINDSDRQIIGNALPDYLLGITNTFSYKGLDLSIFINAVFGQDVLNYQVFEGERLVGTNNSFAYVLDRWTPSNPSNSVSSADFDATRPNRLSDRVIEDATFLRIQNISLGYTFNTNSISWMRKARIYVSGQNLAVFTDYRGYDPEVSSFGQNTGLNLGVDRGAYPSARTITAGVNVTF